MPTKTKKVPTIQEIRGFKWVGNHMSDSGRFDAIDAFVQSDVPMSEKQEALFIMGRDGMGDDSKVTEKDVLEYLEETSDA